uniref:Uncharacterized protein n=1 Tax=Steinernema glaseri TaxID=37863 RepID=A0A1I7YI11_9BILA
MHFPPAALFTAAEKAVAGELDAKSAFFAAQQRCLNLYGAGAEDGPPSPRRGDVTVEQTLRKCAGRRRSFRAVYSKVHDAKTISRRRPRSGDPAPLIRSPARLPYSPFGGAVPGRRTSALPRSVDPCRGGGRLLSAVFGPLGLSLGLTLGDPATRPALEISMIHRTNLCLPMVNIPVPSYGCSDARGSSFDLSWTLSPSYYLGIPFAHEYIPC